MRNGFTLFVYFFHRQQYLHKVRCRRYVSTVKKSTNLVLQVVGHIYNPGVGRPRPGRGPSPGHGRVCAQVLVRVPIVLSAGGVQVPVPFLRLVVSDGGARALAPWDLFDLRFRLKALPSTGLDLRIEKSGDPSTLTESSSMPTGVWGEAEELVTLLRKLT